MSLSQDCTPRDVLVAPRVSSLLPLCEKANMFKYKLYTASITSLHISCSSCSHKYSPNIKTVIQLAITLFKAKYSSCYSDII